MAEDPARVERETPTWAPVNERARVQVRALAGLIVLEGIPTPHG